MDTLKKLFEYRNKEILIIDGAMGTMIEKLKKQTDMCNEHFNLENPALIKEIHSLYLKAGANIIETNSFNANYHFLEQNNLGSKQYEINKKAAEIANKAVSELSVSSNTFVAGAIGPGNIFPSLDQSKTMSLYSSFYTQALGLLDGDVDILLIETCQDLLQAKIALVSAEKAKKHRNKQTPVIVSFSIDNGTKTILGTDISAIISVFNSFDLFAFGLNCGEDPLKFLETLDYISSNSKHPIFFMPNAGLPLFENGIPVYSQTPELFCEDIKKVTSKYNLAIIGGCCGTNPDHISMLNKNRSFFSFKNQKRAHDKNNGSVFIPTDSHSSSLALSTLSSFYSSTHTKPQPPPLIIGERTSAPGSSLFRKAVENKDAATLLSIAKEQKQYGAYAIDINVTIAGRNEKEDMIFVIEQFNQTIDLPFVIDTRDPEVCETALSKIGGKSLINSIHFDDKSKAEIMLSLAKKYGASIILLAIDEHKMPVTAKEKIELADELFYQAHTIHKIPEENIFFDLLTFSLGTGDKQYINSGEETLEAVQIISKKYPHCSTVLGISNISYGLPQDARKILNSVFLYHAVNKGLSAAIINPKAIVPYSKIPENLLDLCNKIIFPSSFISSTISYTNKTNHLLDFISACSDDNKNSFFSIHIPDTSKNTDKNPIEKLKADIIEGNLNTIEKTVDNALKLESPIALLDSCLMPAMKEVGDLFNANKMPLPFVIQSAETLKKAIHILFPNKQGIKNEKKIVMATVKGDIHDIGKNIAGLIFSSNGFNVIDIGVDRSAQNIIKAVNLHHPDFIGLSGLLMQSLRQMGDLSLQFNDSNITIPIVCGGAALNEKAVKSEVGSKYKGHAFYAQNPFAAMDMLSSSKTNTISNGEVKNTGKVTAFNDFLKPISKSDGPANPIIINDINSKQSILFEKIEKNSESEQSKSKKSKSADSFTVFDNYTIPTISYRGIKSFDIPLEKLVSLLNKKLLFLHRWHSKSLEDGDNTLNKLLSMISSLHQHPLTARYGYFDCKVDGNNLIVPNSDNNHNTAIFAFPQISKKTVSCLTDFFGKNNDIFVPFVITISPDLNEYIRNFKNTHSVTLYYQLYYLLNEIIEKGCDIIHIKVEEELNKNIGKRFSFGYPYCPELSEQNKLLDLLNASEIGITTTETFQMIPEFSVAGFVILNPNSFYP